MKKQKEFKDLRLNDSVFLVKGDLLIEEIKISRLDIRGNYIIINYEAGNYSHWFDNGKSKAEVQLNTQWKKDWQDNTYGKSGLLFTLESNARRYCKTQCRTVIERLISEAKEAVIKIKDYRSKHSEGLNKMWRESEIEQLERELR